jgi:signal transduction histidine kinase
MEKQQKPTRISGYETKVKLSILLILTSLVVGNFTSSYLFRRTQQLFLNRHSLDQQILARVCKNDLLNCPDKTKELHTLNRFFNSDDGSVIDILNRQDYELSKAGASSSAGTNLEIAFKNRELYTYYPELELQVAYVPLEVDSSGHVKSLMIIRNQIGWYDFLNRASSVDKIFRIVAIASVAVFGYLIIRMILRPYRKIRHMATQTLSLDSVDFDDPEYAEKAFDKVIGQLKKRENELKDMAMENANKTLGLTARYDYIFGGISSGVIICDRSGGVVRINNAATEILDLDADAEIGKKYSETFSEIKDLKFLISSALYTGKTYSRVEINYKRANYREKLLGATSSLIRDERTELIGAAILLIDLTRIKKIENENAYRDKMASLGEMTAGMAHEIRNSAAAISGFGKLIQKFAADSGKVEEYSEGIIRESGEMEVLMKKFLTFAKPMEINRVPVKIEELYDDAINQIRSTKPNVRIRKIIAGGISVIYADYQLMRQCLYNLLANAEEAIDRDGEIIMKASIFKYYNPTIIHGDTDGFIKITVADDGKGIERNSLERIFDPFYTDKASGTGLGLALVKKIVAQHDGHITVRSRRGRGTIFSIILPVGNEFGCQSRIEPCAESVRV